MHRSRYVTGQTIALILMVLCIVLVLPPRGEAEYSNPAVPGEKTAAYWMDRGGFFSTYGNFEEAIRAYEQALAIDPEIAEAHFDIGLSWGQLEDYVKALASIDKAIALRPQQGRYHYGRGWILMMSGHREQARKELVKAAELGSTEARAYLQRQNDSR